MIQDVALWPKNCEIILFMDPKELKFRRQAPAGALMPSSTLGSALSCRI